MVPAFLPIKPLSERAYFCGTRGIWDKSNQADWYVDGQHAYRNSWNDRDGPNSIADFDSFTGTITAANPTAYGVSVHGALRMQGTVTLPDVAVIENTLGESNWQGATIQGAADLLIKTGNGDFIFNALPNTARLWIQGGSIDLYVNALHIPRITIESGTRLLFVTASNIYLDGILEGAGTLQIVGGGHIFINGIDAGTRGFTPPAGWYGTIITPTVNTLPVFVGDVPSSLYVFGSGIMTPSLGRAVNYGYDADGDAVTLMAGGFTSGTFSNYIWTPSVATPAPGDFITDHGTITAYDSYGSGASFSPYVYVLPNLSYMTGTVNTTGQNLVAWTQTWTNLTGSGNVYLYGCDPTSPYAIGGNNSGFTGKWFISMRGYPEFTFDGSNSYGGGDIVCCANTPGQLSLKNTTGSTVTIPNNFASTGTNSAMTVYVQGGAFNFTGNVTTNGSF